MSLQVSNMEDLFLRYLSQLTQEHPYILLETDEESTTISLGYETCNEEKKELSHLKFFACEKYSIKLDLEKLKKPSYFPFTTTFKLLKNNKLLIEAKIKLNNSSNNVPPLFSTDLIKYLESRRRTVLQVFLKRYFYYAKNNSFYDPIYLEEHNVTTAGIVLHSKPNFFEIIEEFPTTLREIETLNQNHFDVFLLEENPAQGYNLYEIINKQL